MIFLNEIVQGRLVVRDVKLYADDIPIQNCVFVDTDYIDCQFSKKIFRHAVFINCTFTLCRFTESEISNCIFQDCTFELNNIFTKTQIEHAVFIRCSFLALIQFAEGMPRLFRYCTLTYNNFIDCKFGTFAIVNCYFDKVLFQRCYNVEITPTINKLKTFISLVELNDMLPEGSLTTGADRFIVMDSTIRLYTSFIQGNFSGYTHISGASCRDTLTKENYDRITMLALIDKAEM